MHLFVTLLAMTFALIILVAATFAYQMVFVSVPDFDAAVQHSVVQGGVIIFTAILVIYFHMKFLRKKKPAPVVKEETV